MQIRFTHTFEAPPDQLWRAMFDADFMRRLCLGPMQSTAFRLLEHDLGEARWLLRAQVTPKPFGPAALVSLAGSDPSLTWEATYDPASGDSHGSLVPTALADRMRLDYTLAISAAPGGGSVRSVEAEARAQLLGLGWIAERSALEQFRRTFDEGARLYVAERRAQNLGPATVSLTP